MIKNGLTISCKRKCVRACLTYQVREVMQYGEKLTSDLLVLYHYKTRDSVFTCCKLIVRVVKKCGNSVTRNYVKRVLRALFVSHVRNVLKPGILVACVYEKQQKHITYDRLRSSFLSIFEKTEFFT